jgi:hypothetical protein
MEIVILVAWCIWTLRNRVIFDGVIPSFGQWKRSLREELFLSLLKVQVHEEISSLGLAC